MLEQASDPVPTRSGLTGVWRWVALGLVLALALGAVWYFTRPQPPSGNFAVVELLARGSGPEAVVGKPAPDFLVRYPDGHTVKLSQLRGQAVLINFWATWCGPCRVETPDIVRAYQKHKDSKFTVIAVNLEEGPEVIQPFIDEFKIPYPVVRDANGQLAGAYGVKGLPISIMVNAQGNVSLRWAGILTPDTLENSIAAASS